MDNQASPGEATVGSRREMLSVAPFEEADLVAALEEERANGDGLVTMAIHGTTRNNNVILGAGYIDAEKGPTLLLTLAIPGWRRHHHDLRLRRWNPAGLDADPDLHDGERPHGTGTDQ